MSENQNPGNNQDKDGKKVILLDLSRTERAFEEDESLWDIEIEKIEERLAGHVQSLGRYTDEKDHRKKPLLSIAILGYPGSGKTSMLHTFVERVKKGKLKTEGIKNNVFTLPVIKPNLVAEGDHFLYAFLAEALRADREKHKHENDQDRETPFISRVQHKFQEVSEYLQVLNKTGEKHEGDPLGISLERLERHESGLMLIDKMTGFIAELANSLGGITGQSVVLLPVDDADMSREVLTSALDTCWRFIKHPRLVPIFTFTGRLAEELMRVDYDNKLDSGSSMEHLRETATSALVTENMAIQHLGKLFPVRNRIKMGPAAARVQVAKYKPFKGEPGKEEGREVSELLKKASTLLFGHRNKMGTHDIRPPLRMVTLRRQIQIIDAIQGTGIEQIMEKNENMTKTWAEVFDLATWSLLNAHRDVLKEINLNLDDLYSWTPRGLRQVILDCILMQNKSNLAKLHKQWRYRTEDRRSQIISLLAVNTFRPRMDEEPTEDDTPPIIQDWWDNYKKHRKTPSKDAGSFPVIKGALWFLNLSIGFYLPQVISDWNRLPGNKDKDMDDGRVTGIGWGLMSGPLHAVKEALKKKKVFSSGMLFLNPVEFDKPLTDDVPNINKRFFSHVWCYYGFDGEWPWAAISLWRGLGLMGKVLEVFENHRKCSHDHSNCIFDEKEKNDEEKKEDKNPKDILIEKIKKVIERHFESARVFINLPKGKEINPKFQNINTKNWEYTRVDGTNPDSNETKTTKITEFAEAMTDWLKDNCSIVVKDQKDKEIRRKENRIEPVKGNEDWESCFIRRLHGDSMLGIFWQYLQNACFKKNLNDWTAILMLSQWKTILSQYWTGCKEIKDLLESCPIWPDSKSKLFSWGDSQVLNQDEEVQKESGIKRVKLHGYGLFNDEKPLKYYADGSLIIPGENKNNEDGPGKTIRFIADVSNKKKEENKDVKKDVMKDTKKDTKKDVKKDVKKDIKKDKKNEEKKVKKE